MLRLKNVDSSRSSSGIGIRMVSDAQLSTVITSAGLPFKEGSITPTEYKEFGSKSTWRIFFSWSELETDHQKYKVSPATMVVLLGCQQDKPLQEHLAVA